MKKLICALALCAGIVSAKETVTCYGYAYALKNERGAEKGSEWKESKWELSHIFKWEVDYSNYENDALKISFHNWLLANLKDESKVNYRGPSADAICSDYPGKSLEDVENMIKESYGKFKNSKSRLGYEILGDFDYSEHSDSRSRKKVRVFR